MRVDQLAMCVMLEGKKGRCRVCARASIFGLHARALYDNTTQRISLSFTEDNIS